MKRENKKIELVNTIDSLIDKQMKKFGIMGTEVVNIYIQLTDEEWELFCEIEKYSSKNYYWEYNFENKILNIDYREEVKR